MLYLAIEENAGLGNQLFQFAHGYALAEKYDEKITLISYIGRSDAVREYLLDYLNLDYRRIVKVVRVDKMNIFRGHVFKGANALNRLYREYLEKKYKKPALEGKIGRIYTQKNMHRMYIPDPILEKGKDYYIEGFFETYRYFIDYEEKIRQQLELHTIPNVSELHDILKKIKESESVAVHIRMGDFVICERVFPLSYYENAISYIEKIIPKATFFILSEDQWVKERFRKLNKRNIDIIDLDIHNRDIIEWYVISQCKHHIITNSTYSWWAAFAGSYEKKRVFIPNEELYMQRENADIFLDKDVSYKKEHYVNYFLPSYEVLPFNNEFESVMNIGDEK